MRRQESVKSGAATLLFAIAAGILIFAAIMWIAADYFVHSNDKVSVTDGGELSSEEVTELLEIYGIRLSAAEQLSRMEKREYYDFYLYWIDKCEIQNYNVTLECRLTSGDNYSLLFTNKTEYYSTPEEFYAAFRYQ